MEGQIASGRQRLIAAIVDGVVHSCVWFLDMFLEEQFASFAIVFFYYLVSLQFGWAYSTIMHGWRGQTIGKIFAKITVVQHNTEQAIGFRRAFLREVPYVAGVLACSVAWGYAGIAYFRGQFADHHQWILDQTSTCVFFISLGWVCLELITMLIHPQRRAIHDLIAGALVIEKHRG